jgi:hypothetical protein
MTVAGSRVAAGPDSGTTAPPPAEIRYAFVFWLVAAGAGLVRSLLGVLDRGEMIARFRARLPDASQVRIDQTVDGAVFATLMFSLATFGFYFLMARRMAAGRSWARLVLGVIAGVVIPLGLIGMVGLALGLAPAEALGVRITPLMVVTMVVDLGAMAVAVVLMFRPAAGGYVRAVSRARLSGTGWSGPPGR